jgi:hypothetical protein
LFRVWLVQYCPSGRKTHNNFQQKIRIKKEIAVRGTSI